MGEGGQKIPNFADIIYGWFLSARTDIAGGGGGAPWMVDPPADGKVPLLQPEPRVARHRPGGLPGVQFIRHFGNVPKPVPNHA